MRSVSGARQGIVFGLNIRACQYEDVLCNVGVYVLNVPVIDCPHDKAPDPHSGAPQHKKTEAVPLVLYTVKQVVLVLHYIHILTQNIETSYKVWYAWPSAEMSTRAPKTIGRALTGSKPYRLQSAISGQLLHSSKVAVDSQCPFDDSFRGVAR